MNVVITSHCGDEWHPDWLRYRLDTDGDALAETFMFHALCLWMTDQTMKHHYELHILQ